MASQKPTAQSVGEDYSHYDTMWSPSKGDWRRVDEWVFQTAHIWFDPVSKTKLDRPEIIPPTATNIVEHMTVALSAYDFSPHREPAGRGKSNEEKADEIEPWISSVFLQAALQEPSLTWMQAGRNLFMYGRAIIQGPLWDTGGKPIEPEKDDGESGQEYRDRLAAFESEKRDWFPIRIKAPHPARVLCDPLDKQPQLVVMRYKMYAYQLEDLTTLKKAQEDAGGPKEVMEWRREAGAYDLIECTEWWSDQWHALAAEKHLKNNGLTFVEKNTQGFAPFSQIYSGQGGEPTDMGEVEPRYLSRGIILPLIPLLHADAQRLSAEHNAIIEAGFAQEGAENPNAAASAKAKGGILPGKKDQYWYRDIPNYPNYLFQIGAEHVRRINESVPAFTLVGNRQQGVDTVGQQTILTAAAEQVLHPIRRQLGQAASITGQRTLRLVDMQGETVTVNGHKVGPEQIKHDYNLRIDFKLTEPLMKLQQVNNALEMYDRGLYSKEDVWRIAGEEDATGIRIRLLKDKLFEHDRSLAEGLAVLARAEGMTQTAEEFEQVVKDIDAAGGGQSRGLVSPNGQPLRSGPAMPGSEGAARQADTSMKNALAGASLKPGALARNGR